MLLFTPPWRGAQAAPRAHITPASHHPQINKTKGKTPQPSHLPENIQSPQAGRRKDARGSRTGARPRPPCRAQARRPEHAQTAPGLALPPPPPHLVLSTSDSKGQKRTRILFTGRSTTRILDAIFFLPSDYDSQQPPGEAGNGGGACRPPRRHLGNVVRARDSYAMAAGGRAAGRALSLLSGERRLLPYQPHLTSQALGAGLIYG